jgi:hypothetical protein
MVFQIVFPIAYDQTPLKLNMHLYLCFFNIFVLISHFDFDLDPRTQFNRTNRAYLCSGIPLSPCQDIIAGYTLGVPNTCMPLEAGVRIGRKGYKQIMISVSL